MSEKFEIFTQILLKWRKIHSLTSYDSKEKIQENIADSIYPLRFINDFQSALDIGSGCGFPAILLAIKKENANFILLEPNVKKAAFLHTVAAELELKNVKILKTKIQHLKSDVKFDLITSRALFDGEKLIDLSAQFLKKNGYFLFYKGSNEPMSAHIFINNNRKYFYKQKEGSC